MEVAWFQNVYRNRLLLSMSKWYTFKLWTVDLTEVIRESRCVISITDLLKCSVFRSCKPSFCFSYPTIVAMAKTSFKYNVGHLSTDLWKFGRRRSVGYKLMNARPSDLEGRQFYHRHSIDVCFDFPLFRVAVALNTRKTVHWRKKGAKTCYPRKIYKHLYLLP